MMERVERRTIKDPRFSSTSEGSLRRWMTAWDRERKALLANLEPKVEPGEFIPFGLLWVWKIEKAPADGNSGRSRVRCKHGDAYASSIAHKED